MNERIALAWSHLSDIPRLLLEGIGECDPKTDDAKADLKDLETLAETLEELELKHRSIFVEICEG